MRIFALKYLKTLKSGIHVCPETYYILCISLLLLPFEVVISWMISVIIHEVFHYLAVILTGGRVNIVQIGLSGAQMITNPLSRLQEIICAAAGPLGSFLAFVGFIKVFPMTAFFCLIHGAYNIIPLYPLDGGRVIRALLESINYKAVIIFDRCIIVLLILACIYIVVRFALGPIPLILMTIMIFKNKKAKCS